MVSFLITGTSRGLGLEFVRQLLEDPANLVVATARNPEGSAGLQELKTSAGAKLVILKQDVMEFDSADAVAAEAAKHLPDGLDVLILNAGFYRGIPESLSETIDWKEAIEDITMNAIAPMVVFRAFLPLLTKAKNAKVIGISSIFGSLSSVFSDTPVAPVYSMSKAALNMGLRKYANEVNIAVAIVHPGWIRTDMGITVDDFMKSLNFGNLHITASESISGTLKVIRELNMEKSGQFVDHNGASIPW